MEVAPFRALTQCAGPETFPDIPGGNGGRPFQGIDTIIVRSEDTGYISVEMEVAPFRALTHSASLFRSAASFVEMEVAPFRALTHQRPQCL